MIVVFPGHTYVLLVLSRLLSAISGLKVIKQILCSNQISMEFIMLINVKMPTIVGILTFIRIVNTPSEKLKAINIYVSTFKEIMSS